MAVARAGFFAAASVRASMIGGAKLLRMGLEPHRNVCGGIHADRDQGHVASGAVAQRALYT